MREYIIVADKGQSGARVQARSAEHALRLSRVAAWRALVSADGGETWDRWLRSADGRWTRTADGLSSPA